MSEIRVRKAGKAEGNPDGGWYTGSRDKLSAELEQFLRDVPDSIDGIGLPVSGARVIIAPHAGYSYSGPTAGWAYKCLDLSKAKRVFILGPSHTYPLEGCAVSGYHYYATPLGNLKVDESIVEELRDKIQLGPIPTRNDNAEHSLEMHLPILYKRCEQTFGTPASFPTIVPILVGSNSKTEEKKIGKWLAPYMKDPDNAFIISSDFCHWGSRFHYMVYCPEGDFSKVRELTKFDPLPAGPPILDTIRLVDDMAIDAIKTGHHDAFYDNLKRTGNTVCGRHPIGVTMAALEILADGSDDSDKHRFKFVRYQRSREVENEGVLTPKGFCVSYASAYAVL